MGREEKMEGTTKHVGVFVCWLTYVAAFGSQYLVFANPLHPDAYWNGFAAHMVSTFVIYGFSFTFGNSSLYDPAWAFLPMGVSLGWVLTAEGEPTTRQVVTCVLVYLWAWRFIVQWPWQGFMEGVTHEDWRYCDLAKKVGPGSVLHWLLSLIGFHVVPTLNVFFGLAPACKVMSTAQIRPLTEYDYLAFAVTAGAVLIEFIADYQLCAFRRNAYKQETGKDVHLDRAAGSKRACRDGLWNWSRHPNYFGEISFWLGMALIGHLSDPDPSTFDWKTNYAGFVAMYCLFAFYSIPEMDRRNLENRGPEYKAIMEEVSQLIPMPPRQPKTHKK